MTDIADLVAKLDAPADIPRLTDDELTALLVAHAKGMGGLCWNIHHRDLRPPEWPCETWRLATEVRELRAVKDAAAAQPKKCPGCAADVPAAALEAHLPHCSVRQWHEAMDDLEHPDDD